MSRFYNCGPKCPMRTGVCQPTAYFTSTYSQANVIDHLPSLGDTREHAEYRRCLLIIISYGICFEKVGGYNVKDESPYEV